VLTLNVVLGSARSPASASHTTRYRTNADGSELWSSLLNGGQLDNNGA
jgi:hypothetical protein